MALLFIGIDEFVGGRRGGVAGHAFIQVAAALPCWWTSSEELACCSSPGVLSVMIATLMKTLMMASLQVKRGLSMQVFVKS